MIKKIGLSILCAASAFAMHNVELNVNNKDIEMGMKLDMGQFSDSTQPDTVFIGGKFLHGDKEHGDLAKDEDYGELNFLMKRGIGNSGLSIGLGVKANFIKDFASIPLGAEIVYRLPFLKQMPMRVGGSFYYAPEVLTMQDGKDYLEYRFEFDMEIIKNAHLLAGYRNIDVNYEDKHGGDNNFNASPYIGFRFAF